jgi:MFS family permease
MGFIAIPLYASLLGASVFELGIVGTLFSLFYALCCPFSGVASDRLGRRGILTLGCLFTALSFSLMGMTHSMGFFLALNALAGSTVALAWPTLMAWFAETQGKGALGRKLGSFNVAMSLGMTIGPFLGGMLFEMSPSWPFWAAGILTLPIPFLLAGVPSRRDGRSQPQPVQTPSYASAPIALEVQRTFLYIGWTANFVGWFSHNTVRSLFPQLATDLGVTPGRIGLLLGLLRLMQTTAYAVMSRRDGWRFRLGPLLLWQALALSGLLLLFCGRSAGTFGIAFLPIGVLMGVTFQSSLYYSLQGGEEQGKRSGWNESILAGGGLLGPLLGGIIGEPFGLQAPYLLLCLPVMILGMGLEVWLLRRARARLGREEAHYVPHGA